MQQVLFIPKSPGIKSARLTFNAQSLNDLPSLESTDSSSPKKLGRLPTEGPQFSCQVSETVLILSASVDEYLFANPFTAEKNLLFARDINA